MVSKRKSLKNKPRQLMLEDPKQKEKVRLAVECTPEERKYIKMYASYEEKSLNDFVMECVRMRISRCKRSHVPNEETKAALDASERGEGIIQFDSIEDFLNSMEK